MAINRWLAPFVMKWMKKFFNINHIKIESSKYVLGVNCLLLLILVSPY
jgi:hypothetical protein